MITALGVEHTLPCNHELLCFFQMLERETKREKNLETRAKELKIKAKKDQAKTETVTEAESVDDVLKRVSVWPGGVAA